MAQFDFLQALQPFQQSAQIVNALNAASTQRDQFQQQQKQQQQELALRQQEMKQRGGQFDQEQAGRDLANKVNLMQAGATPVNSQGGVNGPSSLPGSELQTPDQSDSGMQAPTGNQMSSAPVDPGRIVSVGSGPNRQSMYIPTLSEQAKTNLGIAMQKRSEERGADLDTYGAVNDTLNSSFGLKPGTKLMPAEMEQLANVHKALQPQKPVKDKSVSYQTNDKGDVTPVVFDQDSGHVTAGAKLPGIGKSKEEKSDQPKAPSKALLSGIESRKAAGLAKAEAQYRKDSTAAKAGGYTDPGAAQSALDTLNSAKQATQNAYEAELNGVGVPTQHVEYSQQKQASGGALQDADAGGPVEMTLPDKGTVTFKNRAAAEDFARRHKLQFGGN